MFKKTLRPLAFSAILLALLSYGLPARDALARLSRRAIAAAHRRGNHRYCHHTRAWWRNYHRVVRERQARARRLRQQRQAELAARQAQLSPAQATASSTGQATALAPHTPSASSEISLLTMQAPAGASRRAALPVVRDAQAAPRYAEARAALRKVSAPAEAQGPRNALDFAVPRTWRLSGASGQGSLKFDVIDRDGRVAGRASLAPFVVTGASAGLDVITPRTKTIGGQALPVLRRAIIDRMFDAGGWVVNDFEREIDGRRVYVVLAQVGQGGVAKESWTFYFTEIEGRLYSLATNTPIQMSVPVAAESEQLLAGLRAGGMRMLAVRPGQEEE
jgi:hypothetical protein